MVMAAGAASPSEDLMKFAANLTIDNEERELFSEPGYVPVKQDPKVPVNANTQEAAAKKNFEAAADRNSSEILQMFGQGLEKGKPGHD